MKVFVPQTVGEAVTVTISNPHSSIHLLIALDEHEQAAEAAAVVDDDTAGAIGIRHVRVEHNVRRHGVECHVIPELFPLAGGHRLRMLDQFEQENGMWMAGCQVHDLGVLVSFQVVAFGSAPFIFAAH
jgi:hypothetical protein